MSDCLEFTIQGFKDGDPESFEKIFNLYFPRLVFFSFKLTGGKASAENIVKDTFVQLWQRREQFADHFEVKAFLYITVRNGTFKFIRQVCVRAVSEKEIIFFEMRQDSPLVLNSMLYAEVLGLLEEKWTSAHTKSCKS